MYDELANPARRTFGANVHALRDHNRALVMDVIRSGDSSSRVEVASKTGLTAQAVSKIVAVLIDHGLVAECGQTMHGVGKPRTRLRLVAGARSALGAQVDRDALRLVLVDLAGTVVDCWDRSFNTLPTPSGVVELLAEGTRELLRRNEVDPDKLVGLGVGLPGPLDHLTGVIHDATSLPEWHDVPLRDLLTARTGLPVIVDKDTNAAIVAERWRRPNELRNAALVYVGTGVGAGLVLDGEVHRGSRTNAGEFGHTTLQADGPQCACGRRGCVEALCGPVAVLRRVADRGVVDPHTPSDWEPTAAARFVELCVAAEHGESLAGAELSRAGRLLGTAVVDLVELLDIDQVILGGSAFRAAQKYFRPAIERALAEQLPRPDWLRVTVRVSDLDADLVSAGAAMLMLSAFYGSHPFGQQAASVRPAGRVSTGGVDRLSLRGVADRVRMAGRGAVGQGNAGS